MSQNQDKNYNFYIDCDNIWIQARKSILPSYNWKKNTLSGETLTDLHKQKIAEIVDYFPELLLSIATDKMTCAPTNSWVVADWNNLNKNHSTNRLAEIAFSRIGFQAISPPEQFSRKTNDSNQFVDFELCLKAIEQELLIGSKNGRILIATGDRFAGRLAQFLRQKRNNVELFFLTCRDGLSREIQDSTPQSQKDNILFLDDSEKYMQFCKKMHMEFKVHKNQFRVSDAVASSAIYHLNRSKMPYVAPYVFKQWLKGWIEFYQNKFPNIDFETDITKLYEDLVERKVVSICDSSRKMNCEINKQNKETSNMLKKIKENEDYFCFQNHVAPARFKLVEHGRSDICD